jgi:hypothetical protein
MDYSLVHDGDFNLKNNYIHKDYLTFMPYLSPVPQGNPKIINLQAQKVYSIHGIGLPLLLAPGFYILAKDGAIIEMVLLATVVVWLTYIWSRQVSGNRNASLVASGLFASCFFVTGLAGFIYPDMLIAALSLATMILLNRYYQSLVFQVLLGLALGFLVLTHYRTLDIVVPVVLILSYKLWKSHYRLPWVTILIVAGFVAYYFLTLHQWFGSFNNNTVYGPGITTFSHTPQTTLSAMLFDSYRGLLIYNPILLLAVVGLPLWFKRHRASFIITVLALGPSIGVLLIFKQWTGPYSPLGRYVMDFLPVFIPALALAIERLRALWQRLLMGLLAVATLFVSLDNALTKFPPSNGSQFVTSSTMFAQIARHTGIAFNDLLPTYSNGTALLSRHSFLKLLVCYVVVTVLLLCGWQLGKADIPKMKRTSAKQAS